MGEETEEELILDPKIMIDIKKIIPFMLFAAGFILIGFYLGFNNGFEQGLSSQLELIKNCTVIC